METATGDPSGALRDEQIRLNREILQIDCSNSEDRGVVLWNLGVGLSNRFDEDGEKQDLEDSVSAFRECLGIADHFKPRWARLQKLGHEQAKLGIVFDSTYDIDEAISTLNECLTLYSATPDSDSDSSSDSGSDRNGESPCP